MKNGLNQAIENHQGLLNLNTELNSIVSLSRESVGKLINEFYTEKKVEIEVIKTSPFDIRLYEHLFSENDRCILEDHKICGILEKVKWHNDDLYFFYFINVNGAYFSTKLSNVRSIKIVEEK